MIRLQHAVRQWYSCNTHAILNNPNYSESEREKETFPFFTLTACENGKFVLP